jgi:ADP-ribosyl-[dinitrogen reductase] hydrolase
MSASDAASHMLPLRNCYWVVPGLLLAGEHPNGATRDKTKDRLKKLLDAGIECFVDLTKPTELLRYDTLLPFYVEYVRKSIKDHGIPSTRAQMIEILEYIANSMRAGRPVYVHCRAGIGRTGTVVGCLLAERGSQGAETIDQLNRLWQQCRRSRSWTFIPETDAQSRYVREWQPSLERGFELSSLATAVATVGSMSTGGGVRSPVASPAPAPAPASSSGGSAGRTGSAGVGGGLRAAAEQARAAVERGEVKAKAPPVPPPSPPTMLYPSSQGTAAPNGGEEAPWVVSPPASTSDTTRSRIPPDNPGPAVTLESARSPVAANQSPTASRASAAQSASAALAPSAPLAPTPARAPVEDVAEVDPLLDPQTLAAARGLRERFLGTMFGLAIGDAVAAATQFRRPGTFNPVGDMLGGGPFDLPRGAWTDDTAMALCLAESLLERDGFDARDQVQRYSRWQQDGYLTSTGQCVGITASTARSLALAKWRRGMVFPGSHDPEQLDPEPLSRIASIALFYFASLESTQQQAIDSSRITCQAPAVLDACRRLSRVLNAALAGQSKAKILAEGGPINEAASQANNTAAAALNGALWAFSSTDNFRDAVLRAANVGGNSDVVATVVGQIAGAHYGASAIPASWRSGLTQKDLIEGISDRLLAHGLVSLSS